MAKTNLGMGGTIRLSLLPEDLDKVKAGQEVCADVEGHELHIQLKAGSKNQILELSPWFDVDHTHVSIDNSVAHDGTMPCLDYVEIDVKDGGGRSFGFTVSPEQAEALAAVLTNYAQASKAVEALRSEQPSV